MKRLIVGLVQSSRNATDPTAVNADDQFAKNIDHVIRIMQCNVVPRCLCHFLSSIFMLNLYAICFRRIKKMIMPYVTVFKLARIVLNDSPVAKVVSVNRRLLVILLSVVMIFAVAQEPRHPFT